MNMEEPTFPWPPGTKKKARAPEILNVPPDADESTIIAAEEARKEEYAPHLALNEHEFALHQEAHETLQAVREHLIQQLKEEAPASGEEDASSSDDVSTLPESEKVVDHEWSDDRFRPVDDEVSAVAGDDDWEEEPPTHELTPYSDEEEEEPAPHGHAGGAGRVPPHHHHADSEDSPEHSDHGHGEHGHGHSHGSGIFGIFRGLFGFAWHHMVLMAKGAAKMAGIPDNHDSGHGKKDHGDHGGGHGAAHGGGHH